MSPLPAWLTGCQSVCMNMSSSDLPVQLHFALFNGSGGFVLKPSGMRAAKQRNEETAMSEEVEDGSFWPPARKWLHHTIVKFVSLHNLPKVRICPCETADSRMLAENSLGCVGSPRRHALCTRRPQRCERRPRYDGTRTACHDYHPELSGTCAPPDQSVTSSPALRISLHPIGGAIPNACLF
eukprot:7391502-Prymnesium_polylepis.3